MRDGGSETTTLRLQQPEQNAVTEPLQQYQLLPQDPLEPVYEDAGSSGVAGSERPLKERGLPRPVSFRWESAGRESSDLMYELLLSKDPAFGGSIRRSSSGNEVSVANLEIGTRYYWRVVAQDGSRPVAQSPVRSFCTDPTPPRWVHVPGLTNLRDLGGWPVSATLRIRQGLIYRCCELNVSRKVAEEGVAALRELGIRTDLDLRAGGQPALDESEARWVSAPVEPYGNIVVSEFVPGYKRAFDTFSDPARYPILLHCAGGVDRTGTVAFLLEALLGLELSSLLQDYELTSLSTVAPRSHTCEGFQRLLSELAKFGEPSDPPRAKVERYLLSIGIMPTQMQTIRGLLLEPIGPPASTPSPA